jgi:5-methylcytosine-specific restriction protein A
MDREIGPRLNEMWRVGAEHPLYRENGTWYHLLERFPGALFDAHGYIKFDTSQAFNEFRSRPGVTGRKAVAIKAGISSQPDYVRVSEPPTLDITF